MQYTVKNDTPFQILTSAIVIGPSQTGYQLEVAADGKNFSPLFTVGANVTRQVTNLSSGAYYRLNGNVGDVIVNWVRSCVTEGGGGDMSNYYTKDETDEAIQEAISGISLDGYWTSAETKTYVDSAVTAVENHLFDVEEVTASALTELHDDILELSGSSVDLSAYYTSAQTEEAISAATSGKADAASVTANTNQAYFPAWNSQGIITGISANNAIQSAPINGSRFKFYSPEGFDFPPIYSPNGPGNTGEILVSTGGRPAWSAVTFPTPDVTKAYVDSAITGVEDHILDVERVTASALTELHQDMGSLSAVVQEQQIVFSSGYNELHTQVLELSARTAPDMSAYTPTTGFSTINGSAITNGGNLVIQGGGGDMSDYWNSAETKTYVDSAATNLQDQIDTMDEVVSSALVDLEGKKVESQDIRHMVKLTQAQYDQLATKDPETFYIIVNSN